MSGTPAPPPYPPPTPPPAPPQPAPSPEPSRGFPWVACVVVAAIVPVLVVVVTVVAVGWLVFMKPMKHPAMMPPASPQTMVGPSAPSEAKPGAPATGGPISADGALGKVKALPEVAEWIANVTAAGGSPHIDIDSEDTLAYTVHVYEVVKEEGDMPSHTATMGWYTVDKATGEVAAMTP